jgi:hypothetical protein
MRTGSRTITPHTPLTPPTPKPHHQTQTVLQTTQPIIESNGFVRWAFLNVAHTETPRCSAALQDLYRDPGAFKSAPQVTPSADTSYYWPAAVPGGNGSRIAVQEVGAPTADALVKAGTPKAGTNTLTLKLGEVRVSRGGGAAFMASAARAHSVTKQTATKNTKNKTRPSRSCCRTTPPARTAASTALRGSRPTARAASRLVGALLCFAC